MSEDRILNVVGKACPLPLIAIAKEVRTMTQGQQLRIIGNDPIFEPTIIEFCHEGGHEVLDTQREGRTVTMIIRI